MDKKINWLGEVKADTRVPPHLYIKVKAFA